MWKSKYDPMNMLLLWTARAPRSSWINRALPVGNVIWFFLFLCHEKIPLPPLAAPLAKSREAINLPFFYFSPSLEHRVLMDDSRAWASTVLSSAGWSIKKKRLMQPSQRVFISFFFLLQVYCFNKLTRETLGEVKGILLVELCFRFKAPVEYFKVCVCVCAGKFGVFTLKHKSNANLRQQIKQYHCVKESTISPSAESAFPPPPIITNINILVHISSYPYLCILYTHTYLYISSWKSVSRSIVSESFRPHGL